MNALWFLVKVWITLDLLILLAFVLVGVWREREDRRELAEFLEDYYRR